MSIHFDRARLLATQSRFAEAMQELHLAVAESPRNARTHSLMAYCAVTLKRLQEATAHAEQAVAIDPEDSHVHYVLAITWLARNQLERAHAAIDEALRFDPTDAAYYAVKAKIHLRQEEWANALAFADAGLAQDGGHADCMNVRAHAQIMLGQKAAARDTLRQALEREPDDPDLHASQGWTCLHRGDHQQAAVHFKEALRLEPDNAYARDGLMEAIKAKNILYRGMLSYFLWSSRLGARLGFALMLGLFMGAQALTGIAKRHPDWGIVIWPLLIAYGAFAFATWLAVPFSNLLMLLHPLGKHAIKGDRKWQALTLLAGLLLVVTVLVAGIWRAEFSVAILPVVFLLAITLICVSVFSCDAGWPRYVMGTIALAFCAFASVPIALLCIDILADDGIFIVIPNVLVELATFGFKNFTVVFIAAQIAAAVLSRADVRQ